MKNNAEEITPVEFDPNLHIAVVCAHKGIDLSHFGRNELCPCGSGKKHKKCCIEQSPVKLCYKFALAETLFHNANCEGDFKRAEELASQHNQLLSVLKLLDPSTFSTFELVKAG